MNETQIETLAERTRKRREYLYEKTQAHTLVGIGFTLTLVFGLITFLGGLSLLLVFIYNLGREGWISLPFIVFGLPFLIVFCSLTRGSYKIADIGEKKYQALVIVPPVHEQIAALPAEEILVRGSEQPATSPSELLRAANQNTVTASNELLRPKDSER